MLARTPRRRIAGSTTRLAVTLVAILTLGAGIAGAHTGFFIQGAQLTLRPDGSWSGPGVLDGVRGKLTLTGKIVLLKTEPHRIHFTWVAGKRRVSGCAYTEVLTRPHGVQLWDGGGQITSTSRPERKYQGVHVSLAGPTRRDDLQHAKISIGRATPHPDQPLRSC
jgi:hypothetical protein